jgi:hypothetical protein
MALNKLENALVEGINGAVEQYGDMAGTSLAHAPESFLQMKIVDALHQTGSYWVYPDISLGRICRERTRDCIFINNKEIYKLRPDISVWYKSSNNIRSLIEIKRTWTKSLIQKDVMRLEKILNENEFIKTAYIIGYWECKSEHKKETLTQKFNNWAKDTKSNLVVARTGEISGDFIDYNDGYKTWGAAILRVRGGEEA